MQDLWTRRNVKGRMLALLVLLMVGADTSVTVQGLVGQPPGTGIWLIGLPVPFRYEGRVVAELELAGDSSRWASHAGHFVEARGALELDSAAPGARGKLRVASMHEVDPAGTVRKMVSNSFTHRVVATLWVLLPGTLPVSAP